MEKLLRNLIFLTLLALSIPSVSTQDDAEAEAAPAEEAAAEAAEVSEDGGEETETAAEGGETATEASGSTPDTKKKTKGYNGYYDIPARDLAYLCQQMPAYEEKGTQPDITSRAPKDLKKDTYIRKEHKCWKMRWSPCEPKDLKKAKPCGWYQMEEAPEKEC